MGWSSSNQKYLEVKWIVFIKASFYRGVPGVAFTPAAAALFYLPLFHWLPHWFRKSWKIIFNSSTSLSLQKLEHLKRPWFIFRKGPKLRNELPSWLVWLQLTTLEFSGFKLTRMFISCALVSPFLMLTCLKVTSKSTDYRKKNGWKRKSHKRKMFYNEQ